MKIEKITFMVIIALMFINSGSCQELSKNINGETYVGKNIHSNEKSFPIWSLNYTTCGSSCVFDIVVEKLETVSNKEIKLKIETDLTDYGIYRKNLVSYYEDVYENMEEFKTCNSLSTDFHLNHTTGKYDNNGMYLCDGKSMYCKRVSDKICYYDVFKKTGNILKHKYTYEYIPSGIIDVDLGNKNNYAVKFVPKEKTGKINVYIKDSNGNLIDEIDPWYDSYLVAYWPFDDGSGDTISDESGHEYDGTSETSSGWLSSSECIQGVCYACANGIAIDLGTVPAMHIKNYTEVSFCGWERKSSQHGDLMSDNTFYIGNYINVFSYQIQDLNTYSTIITNSNAWTFVCGTFNSTDNLVYINGTLDGSNSGSATPANVEGHTYLCGRSLTGGVEPKDVDEFRLYSTFLTAEDVQELFEIPSSAASSSSSSLISSSTSSSSSSIIASSSSSSSTSSSSIIESSSSSSSSQFASSTALSSSSSSSSYESSIESSSSESSTSSSSSSIISSMESSSLVSSSSSSSTSSSSSVIFSIASSGVTSYISSSMESSSSSTSSSSSSSSRSSTIPSSEISSSSSTSSSSSSSIYSTSSSSTSSSSSSTSSSSSSIVSSAVSSLISSLGSTTTTTLCAMRLDLNESGYLLCINSVDSCYKTLCLNATQDYSLYLKLDDYDLWNIDQIPTLLGFFGFAIMVFLLLSFFLFILLTLVSKWNTK